MTHDGGPAFPSMKKGWGQDGPYIAFDAAGMSLRAWLAGQALAGLLANSLQEGAPEAWADMAVTYADLLLARLESK